VSAKPAGFYNRLRKSDGKKTCGLVVTKAEHNRNKRWSHETDRKTRLSGNAGNWWNAGQAHGFLQRRLFLVVHRLWADLFGLFGRFDGGFQADAGEATAKPLPIVYSEDLEETLGAVENAGGAVVKPIFSFPGGRRFHFVDPAGNEMAVWGE
jgi:hypothetical protein